MSMTTLPWNHFLAGSQLDGMDAIKIPAVTMAATMLSIVSQKQRVLEATNQQSVLAMCNSRKRIDWVQIIMGCFLGWGGAGAGGQQPLVPLLLLGPQFCLFILFLSSTLLTTMTGISLRI
jgi:hypothetical protein